MVFCDPIRNVSVILGPVFSQDTAFITVFLINGQMAWRYHVRIQKLEEQVDCKQKTIEYLMSVVSNELEALKVVKCTCTHSIYPAFQLLKNSFQHLAVECRREWRETCDEFLSTTAKIAQFYEMQLGELRGKLECSRITNQLQMARWEATSVESEEAVYQTNQMEEKSKQLPILEGRITEMEEEDESVDFVSNRTKGRLLQTNQDEGILSPIDSMHFFSASNSQFRETDSHKGNGSRMQQLRKKILKKN